MVSRDQSLRRGFDRTARLSGNVTPVDTALLVAGRKIADRIDEATATGEGQEVTKALYLIPHMVNILREMLATPAARVAADKKAGQADPAASTIASLRSIHGGRS